MFNILPNKLNEYMCSFYDKEHAKSFNYSEKNQSKILKKISF